MATSCWIRRSPEDPITKGRAVDLTKLGAGHCIQHNYDTLSAEMVRPVEQHQERAKHSIAPRYAAPSLTATARAARHDRRGKIAAPALQRPR